MYVRSLALIFLTAVLPTSLPSWAQSLDTRIEKISPKGTYRVKLEISTVVNDNGLPIEQAQIQVTKRNEVVFAVDPFYGSDPLEVSFLKLYPRQEWVNDSVFRFGNKTSSTISYDEIVATNKSGENLKHLVLNYGRFEKFMIFDLPNQTKVTLHPRRHQGNLKRAYVIYSGTTQDGRFFQNITREFKTAPNGSLVFRVEIR